MQITFSGWKQRNVAEAREIGSMRRTHHCCWIAGGRAHGKHEREHRQLLGAKTAWGWQPVRKWGLGSYTCKELNLTNNLSLETSLGSLERNAAQLNTLIIILWTRWFMLVHADSWTRWFMLHPDIWLTELWNNNWVLFQATKLVTICYSSNRNLIQLYFAYWILHFSTVARESGMHDINS